MDKLEIADEAVRQQKLFKEYLQYSGVIKPISWVCQDFAMAELLYGEEGVRNEFTIAVKMYFDNINYFAQLVLLLYLKLKEHFDKCNYGLAITYQSLYEKAYRMMRENFDDEDVYYGLELLN